MGSHFKAARLGPNHSRFAAVGRHRANHLRSGFCANTASSGTVPIGYSPSWASGAGSSSVMEPCTAEQVAALTAELNKPPLAPEGVEVTLEFGECRQIANDRPIAFALYMPEVPSPMEDDGTSVEEILDRPFRLTAGLFDTKDRRVTASYVEAVPFGGWIQLSKGKAHVIPTAFGRSEALMVALSLDQAPGANAADLHVGQRLLLLMQHGGTLKPVLRDIPLSSSVALTREGGICCAHVLMETTRSVVPTNKRSLGMPGLTIRAERGIDFDETRGPLPKEFCNIPKTYSYTMRFDGHGYQRTDTRSRDAWDALDD